MTPASIPVEGARSVWRRIGLWLEQWAEAIEFDIAEHHERRITQIEQEIAALRAKAAVSGDVASSPRPADETTHKEIS